MARWGVAVDWTVGRADPGAPVAVGQLAAEADVVGEVTAEKAEVRALAAVDRSVVVEGEAAMAALVGWVGVRAAAGVAEGVVAEAPVVAVRVVAMAAATAARVAWVGVTVGHDNQASAVVVVKEAAETAVVTAEVAAGEATAKVAAVKAAVVDSAVGTMAALKVAA